MDLDLAVGEAYLHAHDVLGKRKRAKSCENLTLLRFLVEQEARVTPNRILHQLLLDAKPFPYPISFRNFS